MAQDKRVEDYLHLYLGCECMIEERVKVILCGFQQDGHNVYKPVVRPLNYAGFEAKKVNDFELLKPILRPLSDMTEEEATEIFWKPIKGENFTIKTGEEFRLLLSKHFDLFGLHEAGLCLYKTDLK